MDKYVITLIIALLLLTTPCYAGGIAPDKQKHIGVAAGMNLAMEAMGVKKINSLYNPWNGLYRERNIRPQQGTFYA